jgi:signal transduction histidine kinase
MSGYLANRLRVAGGDLAIAEARAEEAERLAALGRLAAGLAHEIRNPLGGIAGSIELLRTSPGLTQEDRHLCDIVNREAERLNDLVDDMLDLARPRVPQPEDLEAAQLARDVVDLAARSGRGEDVHVRYDGLASLHLFADASQLRQVLWNLVRNAVQASSAGDEVIVRTSRTSGGEAAIEVIDQGPGIPSNARDRIFDAFYTTRSHGTGVGLAVVKRIVDAHRWRIEVDGDDGATFRVLVPRDAVVERPPAEKSPES